MAWGSVRTRNQDADIREQFVMVVCFRLLRVEAVVRLRNFVVFIKKNV